MKIDVKERVYYVSVSGIDVAMQMKFLESCHHGPSLQPRFVLRCPPKKRVSLLPRDPETTNFEIVNYPKGRVNGWLELSLGDFYNDGFGNVRVDVANMIEFQYNTKRKKGLIIDRMEFRPLNNLQTSITIS